MRVHAPTAVLLLVGQAIINQAGARGGRVQKEPLSRGDAKKFDVRLESTSRRGPLTRSSCNKSISNCITGRPLAVAGRRPANNTGEHETPEPSRRSAAC
jgi:hypothetical protein